jgi:hypothetical protein
MHRHLLAVLSVVLAGALLGVTAASARTAAVPRNTAPPTISGTVSEGNTLTANNGSWANSPTSFAYQWRRCDSAGSGCTDIAGATKKTYTLTSDDSDHTVRVVVTASNADGQATATSDNTQLISSKNAPVNTVKPTVSGTEKVGEQLTATNGSWTGGVTSYAYQWQRCDSSGGNCVDVAGATGNTYGVRSADAGNNARCRRDGEERVRLHGGELEHDRLDRLGRGHGDREPAVAVAVAEAADARVPLAEEGRYPRVCALPRLHERRRQPDGD